MQIEIQPIKTWEIENDRISLRNRKWNILYFLRYPFLHIVPDLDNNRKLFIRYTHCGARE